MSKNGKNYLSTEEIPGGANWNQKLIDLRRELHRRPECSGEEWETAELLKSGLKKLGWICRETEGPGFIAIWDTKKPGKTLAFRADLDALPLEEAEKNLNQKRCVCSQIPQLMHACGHDAHMALLTVLAEVLESVREKIRGQIVLIYESGEEDGSGIEPMCSLLDQYQEETGHKIDALLGNHVLFNLPSGLWALRAGAMMAGTWMFRCNIQGKGGHSSRPDLACNPIDAGTQILSVWNSAWVNRVDQSQLMTLGIGKFFSGSAANIIPEKAEIEGTLRCFDEQAGNEAFRIMQELAENTAKIQGCTAQVELLCHNPPVENDEYLVQRFKEATAEVKGMKLVEATPWFASESFARYKKIAPCLYSFIGIENKEKGTGAGHHNPHFDVDEAVLEPALRMYLAFILSFLADPESEAHDLLIAADVES